MPSAIILTSLPIEYMAVRAHLENLREERHTLGTIYERGIFKAKNSAWEIGIAEIEAGNINVSVELERAILHFDPDFLFLVGTADSINQSVEIGDVVAATKVYGYESGNAGKTFSTTPEVGESTYELVQRAKAEARKGEWINRIRNTTLEHQPNVYVHPIAAGEKVISSTLADIYSFLRESYNDAFAVDMGGIGFLKAAFAHTTRAAIVIRGISHSTTSSVESREKVREYQKQAANCASAFAFEMLSKLVLPDDYQASNPIETAKSTYHNLPERPYKSLVGRKDKLDILLERISSDFHERIITITGIGGVGKTSLALEAAYRCLPGENSLEIPDSIFFDVIVFSSARLTTLSPVGIVPSQTVQKPIETLKDLCTNIDNILSKSGLKASEPALQEAALQEFLSRGNYRILLILDNLEALGAEETYEIREFLKKIKGNHVKTIITTRYSDNYDINLKELSDTVSLEMINYLLQDRHCSVEADFPNELNMVCGGIPLAIIYAIGILELEKDTEQVLKKLRNPEDDLCKYCFDQLVSEIEDQHIIEFQLFLTLSISTNGLTRENLFVIAGIDDRHRHKAEYALDMLERCSLIFCSNGRYRMLPLTRRYAFSKPAL
ncbi:nucleoside phosphorylase [Leptolyngbya sp. PCC 7375]|nr:nucleoside phosphorylase [Leptolyngbya sp. PCC 7375]